MEAEKELSDDLLEQYRLQAEKDQKMVEMLTEMNKAFYCEMCDRQYTKYSEFDNHINSYSHHHEQVSLLCSTVLAVIRTTHSEVERLETVRNRQEVW